MRALEPACPLACLAQCLAQSSSSEVWTAWSTPSHRPRLCVFHPGRNRPVKFFAEPLEGPNSWPGFVGLPATGFCVLCRAQSCSGVDVPSPPRGRKSCSDGSHSAWGWGVPGVWAFTAQQTTHSQEHLGRGGQGTLAPPPACSGCSLGLAKLLWGLNNQTCWALNRVLAVSLLPIQGVLLPEASRLQPSPAGFFLSPCSAGGRVEGSTQPPLPPLRPSHQVEGGPRRLCWVSAGQAPRALGISILSCGPDSTALSQGLPSCSSSS